MSLTRTSRRCNAAVHWVAPITALCEGLERSAIGQPLKVSKGAFHAVQRMFNEAHYAFESGVLDHRKYSPLPAEQRTYSPPSFDFVNALGTMNEITSIYFMVAGKELKTLEEREKAIRE